MRGLLDINVLIALLDSDHIHHRRATDWLGNHHKDGWASCPITQNGCVRIMSQPGYPNALPTAAVFHHLAAATRHPKHEFWPDDISLLHPTVADGDRIHGPRQVTDLYLLALATKHAGTFVTLDRRIPMTAVQHATDANLTVIP